MAPEKNTHTNAKAREARTEQGKGAEKKRNDGSGRDPPGLAESGGVLRGEKKKK